MRFAKQRIVVAWRLIRFLCVLCCLLFSPLASAQEKSPRPNILLLVADDQRADTIGILGNARRHRDKDKTHG